MSTNAINTDVESDMNAIIVGFNSNVRKQDDDLNLEAYGYRKQIEVKIQKSAMCIDIMPNKSAYRKSLMMCGVNIKKNQETCLVITFF